MASDWEKTTLDDVCIKITDGAHKSPKSVESGKPMASVKDLEFYGLNLETARHISEEDYLDLVRQGCKPELGDVLIAKDGNSALDTVCTFEKNDEVVLLSSVAILRPNPEKIDSRFLKYYFLSVRTIEYLKRNFISGAAIPRVVLRDFKKAEIQLPPTLEQKAIAHILGTLDDKIELNRQMNATLEAMAQALFKSWFVDFDPVIDNALTAGKPIPEVFAKRAEQRQAIEKNDNADVLNLFPDEFEFTEEMGWIPRGWVISEVQDFGRVVCGKTPSKKKAKYYGNDISFIKIPDMHHVAWATTTINNLSFEGSNSQKNKLIPKGSVCVSCIATVGKVLITSREAHTNQQINSLIPAEKNTLYYLYSSFLGMEKNLKDLASGGAVTLNLNTSNFSKIKLMLPASAVLDAYDSSVNSLYEKNLQSLIQNQDLAKLRDTLLPKLMSGELRLDEVEILDKL